MDILALLGIQQGKRGLVMPWLLWSVFVWCHHSFRSCLFEILSVPRYLLEVVTFVAVIVVSMVCGSMAKITMFISYGNSNNEACDIDVMLSQ